MLPNKPPYFYKCNSCGEIFSSKEKGKGTITKLFEYMLFKPKGKSGLPNLPIPENDPVGLPMDSDINSVINFLNRQPKCPKCGSKKVREIPFSK